MKTSYVLKRLIPYLAKYKHLMIFDLCFTLVIAVSNIVMPMIVRHITNATESLTIKLICFVTAIYIIVVIATTVANFYRINIGTKFGSRVETDMRLDLFKHLQKLSYSFYSENSIGQIMSRITNDLNGIESFIHLLPEQFIVSCGTIIISFIVLLRINITLTLVVFAFIPLVFISTKYFNKRMKASMKEQRVQVGVINSQIEDTLSGIRLVKSFTNEKAEIEKFSERNNEYLKIKLKTFFQFAGFLTTVGAMGNVIYIVVVVLGAVFLMNGEILAGDYAAYLLYISTLWSCIRTLADFTDQFQRGMTGVERLVELMDEKPEIIDVPNPKLLTSADGGIEFKNVSFRYKDNERNVLSDISFKINKGENIAFVGSSGGGKTTLINLIPRFYDVTGGKILINGEDIRTFKISSVRKLIGIVQQDVYLFSGTVFENIVYGRLDASREKVIEAAKKAGAHEFISALENGYDTYIGEHGVKLSGGQKQRISIARVFLKNPPILVLDEATSALDNESERLVQDSLEKLSHGRTVITIAHRLTTIQNADKIMVLTQNGIEEIGTHTELMEKKGIYYNMHMAANIRRY